MAKCICALGKRGRRTCEWNDGSKDHIYCCGCFDRFTDRILPECESCADNVNKAQQDLDEWNDNQMLTGSEIPNKCGEMEQKV